MEASGKLRVLFRVNLQHYRFARHVSGRSRNFRSRGVTWPAPLSPEVHQYRHWRILQDLIEKRLVRREGLSDWRQHRFTSPATPSTGHISRRNAVSLSAMATRSDDRHRSPPSTLNWPQPYDATERPKASRTRRILPTALSVSRAITPCIQVVDTPSPNSRIKTVVRRFPSLSVRTPQPATASSLVTRRSFDPRAAYWDAARCMGE